MKRASIVAALALCPGLAEGSDLDLEGTLKAIHDDYVELRPSAYRLRVFAVHDENRAAKASERLEQYETALRTAAEIGADGLEPLLLAYADALASSDPTTASAADALTAEHADTIHYAGPAAINVLSPLARFDTALVVDVRSDAARVLLDQLLARRSVGLLSELVDVSVASLCDLPISGSGEAGTDTVAGLSEALEVADLRRQMACDELGGGLAGGGSDLVSAMAAGDCLGDLPAVDAIDEYTDAEHLADLEACYEDLTATGGPVSDGVDWTPDRDDWVADLVDLYADVMTYPQVKTIEGLAAVVNALFGGGEQTPEPDPAEPGPTPEGGGGADAGAEAERVAAEAGAEQAEHQGRADELGSEIEGLEGQRDAIVDTANGAELPHELQQMVDELEAEIAEKTEEQEEEQEAADDARARKEAAEKVAREAKGSKDPGSEFYDSEACQRAMLGGKTLAEIRLGEDWTDPASQLAPVINPIPDGPDDPDDLDDAGDCGLDPNTAADPCESVVDCLEDSDCGCPGPVDDEGQLLVQATLLAMQQMLCKTQINCPPDDECTCGSAPPWSGGPPPPPPVDSTLIDSVFFGNQGVGVYFDLAADPASAMAVRSLVSEERVPRDR